MLSRYNVLLILTAVSLVHASSGDRAWEYQRCVSQCSSAVCADPNWATSLPLSMRITRWTCTDDCKYGCMHSITDHAIAHSLPVQQYHGKWPFWRFAGMQEPASVAFSLLNFLVHARGALHVKRSIAEGHPMKGYYLKFALVSMNAWVWSSVFHTRDLPITEKFDYFFAALAILYAVYYTVIRLFHLYSSETHRPSKTKASCTNSRPHALWALTCIVMYLGHVSYLSLLPRFDYTYNMAFNLGVGMAHNLLWVAYSLPSAVPLLRRFPFRPHMYRPTYASRAAFFVLTTIFATSLELFDFPPWHRVIDAHSLWHLSTVPIAAFWYDFLVLDSQDDGWKPSRS